MYVWGQEHSNCCIVSLIRNKKNKILKNCHICNTSHANHQATSIPVLANKAQTYYSSWFKHILFMTEHDKGLGRAKKLCLALSKTHTCTYNLIT